MDDLIKIAKEFLKKKHYFGKKDISEKKQIFVKEHFQEYIYSVKYLTKILKNFPHKNFQKKKEFMKEHKLIIESSQVKSK